MAIYVVTRVLWSDSEIRPGEKFAVFWRYGWYISSQSQLSEQDQEWPEDAVLALVRPDNPRSAGNLLEFDMVTARWERWIAPASEQTVREFAALPRELLLKAYERERALEQRQDECEARCKRAGGGMKQVVDADSGVADHSVLSIVIHHGHHSMHPSLVVAIWPSGRIVWSNSEVRKSGAPYREGHVSKETLAAFRQRLTEEGIMDGSAFGRGGSVVVSGSSTAVRILWDGAVVRTRSSRDLYPHAGEGEAPEFVKAWETLKDEIRKLIPTESSPLPDYDFQILSYPIPQKTDAPRATD
jgi:hypothetical protein